MNILKEINQNGTTVIVVTHDNRVAGAADRQVTMRDGCLTAVNLNQDQKPVNQISDPIRLATTRKRIGFRNLWLEPVLSALDGLSSRPARTLALVTAFLLGIGGLVAASGIGETTSRQISDLLAAGALDEVTVQESENSDLIIRAKRAEQLRQLPHVQGVGLRINVEAVIAQVSRFQRDSIPGQVKFDGRTTGVDSDYLRLNGVHTNPQGAVKLFDKPDSGNVAILGVEAAKKLGIPTGSQNTQIWVTGQPFTVIAVIADDGRQKTFNNTVLVPSRTLIGYSAEWFVLTETGYPADVAQAIPYAFNPAAPGSVGVSTVADLRSLRRGVANNLGLMLFATASLLLIMAILSAGTAMFISVQSRISEVALRRALGMSRNLILKMFLAEGALLGLAGGLAGGSAGTITLVLIAAIQGWTAVMNPSIIVWGLLIGLLGGSISAILPALRAARIEPAQAIR